LRTHTNENNKNQLRQNTIKQTKDQNLYIFIIDPSKMTNPSQVETESNL